MNELPNLADWNDSEYMFESIYKINKEEYLKSFDEVDALTFIMNGIDLFGEDFFNYLKDKELKDKLAIKLFNESIQVDCWEFYRRFIQMYGVDSLLEIYNGDTLSKIKNDGHKYIIIAAMLEKGKDYVLEYALNDDDFLKNMINNSPYYYSLLCNIDYDLMKKYLIRNHDFVKKYFIMNNSDYERLFNDKDINEDLLSKIITKINDTNFISSFFMHDKRALNIFKKLDRDDINYLINKNVSFSKAITNSNYLFESIEDESLINFRNKVNKITINSNYLDIENKVYNYYSKLLDSYNHVTGLFNIYEKINEIKQPYKNNYLLSSDVYWNNNYDDLKKKTSKKISEIVIDYLFKDNIYNVFINIREMLSYNASLKDKIISNDMVNFYRTILDIDKMSNEDKIKMFYRFKNYRIDTIFYDDINTLRKSSYSKLKDEVLYINPNNKSNDLSNKYGVDIYDYRDKEFLILARVLNTPFMVSTSNLRDCFSLISNEHVELIYPKEKYIYGYNNFEPNKILHVYEHDAYSCDLKNGTRYINRIYKPRDLIDASTRINEIQIMNTKKNNRYYESIQPSYIIAIDKITDEIVNESNRLNIPIILINEKHKDIINKPPHTDYGRDISNDIFGSNVLYSYTASDYISKSEEQERNNNRK